VKEIRSNQAVIDEALAAGRCSSEARPVFILVVGRPGSGKSTFIREKIGEEFLRLDAGHLYFEVGGENTVDFPGTFQEDLDNTGREIAARALSDRLDMVMEFTGSDTVRMQMLMRALGDLGYEVDIKYIKVDLNQSSLWSMEVGDASIPAQETDSYHFAWLTNAVNTAVVPDSAKTQSDPADQEPKPGLMSSMMKSITSRRLNLKSIGDAEKVVADYRQFTHLNRPAIPDCKSLPADREIILRAFEMVIAGLPSDTEPEIRSKLETDWRSVFEFQPIDAHDRKLVEELNNGPADREISVALTRDDLKASEEEDLELVRRHRGRLIDKYRGRAEREFNERSNAAERVTESSSGN